MVSGISDEKKAPEIAAQSAIQSLTGGGLGALTGGALGLGGSKILQGINSSRLKNAPFQNRQDKQILKILGNDYYKNYIQETTTNQKDLGRIYFGYDGLKETLKQQTKNTRNFPDLKNKIKNAEYIGEEKLTHPREDNIIKFHRLRNNGEDFLIGETKNGKKYYLSKDTENNTKKAVPERGLADHMPEGLSDTTNNSITNNPENVNSSKKVIRPKNTEYNKTAVNKFNDYIDSQKYQDGNLDVQKGRVNNKFYTKTLNNENNDIERAGRKFNEILDKIKKNPEILNNADEISKMEQELSQMPAPEDFANDMFNKFYNIVGGSDKMLSREFKQSRLPKNANLPKEIEKAVKKIPPEYEVLHNKDLIAQAVKDIENDTELSQKLINKAVSGDKNNKEFSALEFEQTRQLIDKLYSEGKNEEALNLTRLVSEAGSRAGQAVQAMSLWKRTTPAGAVKNAQHIIDEFKIK